MDSILLCGGEKKYRCAYKLNDEVTVNLTSTIDRIDRIVDNNIERVRIVDYKTGGDNTDVKDFVNLFEKPTATNAQKLCSSYSSTAMSTR